MVQPGSERDYEGSEGDQGFSQDLREIKCSVRI